MAIYIDVGSPNLGFTYLNLLGKQHSQTTPCIQHTQLDPRPQTSLFCFPFLHELTFVLPIFGQLILDCRRSNIPSRKDGLQNPVQQWQREWRGKWHIPSNSLFILNIKLKFPSLKLINCCYISGRHWTHYDVCNDEVQGCADSEGGGQHLKSQNI